MADLIQMLQYTLAQKDPLLPNETRRIVLKEALQAYVLDFLYNQSSYRLLNFYGGTCLHVVYGLNRLSEDIDLDNNRGLNTENLQTDLIHYFQQTFGYSEMTAKTQMGENGILRVTLKFPLLNVLGLSPHPNEVLHLKLEISHHKQVAVTQKTPVFAYGRSFVPLHFSLETMMAGKILACLEREFQHGCEGTAVEGRDFYDLLWLMQKDVQPLEEKLARDGKKPYTVASAMQELRVKVQNIRHADLAVDLLSLFEQRPFIEAWLDGFHENFSALSKKYG